MIIDFFVENLHDWTLVLCTTVLAIFTLILAVTTGKLVRLQIEPRVSIRAEWGRDMAFELVVSNEGQGVAKNIRCDFEGDNSHFRCTLGLKNASLVDELHFIKNGIEQLEAGQTYRYLIGGTSEKAFEAAAKSPWQFRLQYTNLYGQKIKDAQTVEFSHFRGSFVSPKQTARHLRNS